jgi:hypothetical protein
MIICYMLASISAFLVARSVVQLPKMVVSPSTCTAPGDWNAIMIATLSSEIRSRITLSIYANRVENWYHLGAHPTLFSLKVLY